MTKADGESAVLATIAAMQDRAMGERLHAIIKASAPALSPKLWYGMPAYAQDGKVVCFFRSAEKFKERYMTLGFNETPGFRAGAALAFHPLDPKTRTPMRLSAVPLLFMDSQFYDYAPLTGEERREAMAHWLGEVAAVGGTASVVWHQQAFSRDYGWEDGYRTLLGMLPS